jgi:hypothetical protein
MNIHDLTQPIMRYFREKRMAYFAKIFGLRDTHRIVDVGGSEFNWALIPQQPQVTMVNIIGESWERGRFRMEVGDARALRFEDDSFDICYSNSVIEHVGSWEDQKRFAAEVRRMAPQYYVQTPNRAFVVEPHLLTPFIHFLPREIARKLMRNFTVHGLITRPSQQWIDDFLAQTRLLTVSEMQTLFPDATIFREKFFGMTKSIIAIRQ